MKSQDSRGSVKPFVAPPRERRSLSHVGGAVSLDGAPDAAAALARAVDVPTSEEAEQAARAHVHGFHSYPARMHPLTAKRLTEQLSTGSDVVLDPFCGSGTVVVEARLAGRRAIGVDANPLAIRLARLKARGTTQAERERLIEAAAQAAAVADARRKARSGPTHRYGGADTTLFDPHVLLELDGLRLGIDEQPDKAIRDDLELAFSAILTKVSRRTSDTSANELPRRIAAGYPARLFTRKVKELCERLAEVETALAASPQPRVLEGDARVLSGIASGEVDLIVTSPPYPGVYDYVAHHEARLRWLRLPMSRFEASEIGARRRLDPMGARQGRDRWQQEIADTLRAMHRVLKPPAAHRPGGKLVLLLADSVVAGAPIYADDLVRAVAPSGGFEVTATASQLRPHFHPASARAFAQRARREHTILLERLAGDIAPKKPGT